MSAKIVEVTLPNGSRILAQVREIAGGGATKTAAPSFDFTGVSEALEGVTDALRSAVSRAKPDKVTVELGLELAVKAGVLVGLIVDGESKGSMKILLEWSSQTSPTATTSAPTAPGEGPH